MTKERIKYYDFLKVLAIFSIILLNTYGGLKVLFHGHRLSFYMEIFHLEFLFF